MSILILCWCRFVRQRPNSACFFPPPLPLATPSRHFQQLQVVGQQPKALQETSAKDAAFEYERTDKSRPIFVTADVAGQRSQLVGSHSTSAQPSTRHSRLLQQVPESEGVELSSDPMVQEMMTFSRNALLRAGIDPSSVSTSDGASVVSTKISTQPPVDAAAAIQEMLHYTNSVLEFMSLEQSRPKSSAV